MFVVLFGVRRTLKRSTSLRGAAHKGGDVAIPPDFPGTFGRRKS